MGLGLGGGQEFSEYTVVKIKLADNFPCLGISCYVSKGPLFSQCDVLLGTDVIGKGKPLGLAFPNNSDPVLYFNPTFEQGSLEVEGSSAFRACSCTPGGKCLLLRGKRAFLESVVHYEEVAENPNSCSDFLITSVGM